MRFLRLAARRAVRTGVATDRFRALRRVAAPLGLLATIAAPLCAQAPAAAPSASDSLIPVSGAVRGPNGLGIANAEVAITPRAVPGLITLTRRMYSDDSGGFRVPAFPRGTATIAVRRIGYKPISVETTLPFEGPLVMVLESAVQQLSAVVVHDRRRVYEGPLADFNRRRDFGLGRFITRTQIDARNAIRTSDLLRTVPGISVSAGFGGTSLSMRGARCQPLIWIDGTPAFAGPLDVDIFSPNTLAGIEIYSGVSEVPVELRGPRGEERCGVIAMWSRMPERRPKQSKRKPLTADEINALIASATVYTADQVDQAALMNPEFPLEPTYPDSLKATRTQGSAMVEFIVDTDGRVETETISVVMASHPAFGRAAREAAFSVRFTPAQHRGGVVRQLVQLPVQFQIASVRKD